MTFEDIGKLVLDTISLGELVNEMIWIILHSIHWQQQGLAVGFRHVLSYIKEGGFGEYQLYMQCMFSMHEIAKGLLVKKTLIIIT